MFLHLLRNTTSQVASFFLTPRDFYADTHETFADDDEYGETETVPSFVSHDDNGMPVVDKMFLKESRAALVDMLSPHTALLSYVRLETIPNEIDMATASILNSLSLDDSQEHLHLFAFNFTRPTAEPITVAYLVTIGPAPQHPHSNIPDEFSRKLTIEISLRTVRAPHRRTHFKINFFGVLFGHSATASHFELSQSDRIKLMLLYLVRFIIFAPIVAESDGSEASTTVDVKFNTHIAPYFIQIFKDYIEFARRLYGFQHPEYSKKIAAELPFRTGFESGVYAGKINFFCVANATIEVEQWQQVNSSFRFSGITSIDFSLLSNLISTRISTEEPRLMQGAGLLHSLVETLPLIFNIIVPVSHGERCVLRLPTIISSSLRGIIKRIRDHEQVDVAQTLAIHPEIRAGNTYVPIFKVSTNPARTRQYSLDSSLVHDLSHSTFPAVEDITSTTHRAVHLDLSPVDVSPIDLKSGEGYSSVEAELSNRFCDSFLARYRSHIDANLHCHDSTLDRFIAQSMSQALTSLFVQTLNREQRTPTELAGIYTYN
jgi:hypothetical protein